VIEESPFMYIAPPDSAIPFENYESVIMIVTPRLMNMNLPYIDVLVIALDGFEDSSSFIVVPDIETSEKLRNRLAE
jgi:hypothetical protein